MSAEPVTHVQAVVAVLMPIATTVDGVNQHGRSNDIHLGRLDGDERRCLVGHGWGSWRSWSFDLAKT